MTSFLQTNPHPLARAAVNTDQSGKPITFPPLWGASAGAAPTLGNGTLTGYYVNHGDSIEWSGMLTGGATTTWGNAGVWIFTLGHVAFRSAVGSASMYDASANLYYVGSSLIVAGTQTISVLPNATAGATFNVPFAWAVNDILIFNIKYTIR